MNLDIFYQNILHYCVFTFTLVFCHVVLLRSHFSLASKYKFKVLWTTTAFGLVYGLLSLLGLYLLNIELRKSIEAKLLGYAPSYAITFEKMNYEKFHEKTARDDKTYLDLIDLQKKWLEKNPYISDIYTMKLGADGNIRLIVDSETDYNRDGQFSGERELRTEIGEIFSKDLPELKSAFQGQTSLVSKPYSDRWGEWVSAFVPLRSPTGQIIGVLGVDYEAKLFADEINKTLYSFFGFFVVLYIILVKIWTSRLEAYNYSRELKAALQIAKEAETSKGRFLSYMSHEIRTPLNGIVSISNSLANKEFSPQEISTSLKILRSSSDQLLELVNNILDLTKIESRKMMIEDIQFDMASLVQDALNVVSSGLTSKGLEVRTNLKIEPNYLYRGDATKIKQVLVNLLSNAIKFTESGFIQLNINEYVKDNLIFFRFEVIDMGIGIAADKIEKLFSEYEQIELSTNRKFGGTGLGLWISKGLVQIMNGQIGVQSQLEQGSLFYFEIPLSRTLSDKKSRAKSIEPVILRDIKILVVDDNEVNRYVLGIFLRKIGYTFDEATNGAEAVQMFCENHYHLIFMDCKMPIVDGYEATQRIREIEKSNSNPVQIIAVTADQYDENKNKCVEAGMDGFISKPIHFAEIHRILSNNRMEQFPAIISTEQSHLSKLKIIDINRAYKAYEGDEDIFYQLLEKTVQNLPGKIEALQKAINERKTKLTADLLHAFKGTISGLFANELIKKVKKLEISVEEEDWLSAEPLFDQIISCLSDLKKEINDILKNRKGQ